MLVFARASQAAAIAASVLILPAPASAQEQGRSPNFFLDNLFGGNTAQAPAPARREVDEADLTVQINQLQSQVRQLTGTIEQLQYRNQQLEQQVRALQGNPGASPVSGSGLGSGSGAAGPGAAGYPVSQPSPRGMQQTSPLPQNYPPPVIAAAPGRRGDVFDPNEHPNAPGAPRVLGSPSTVAGPDTGAQPPIGIPGGRAAGAPLDLSLPGADPSLPDEQGLLPPPPPRNPNATGGAQLASVAPPSATPRDEFDLAFGYVQRKDYALAEDSLRVFLKKYPSDTRVPDAQYWLGESLYQRQRYRDAAESFLAVTTKFDRSSKAPDALMRLGQSLAALGEKETACAAWGEIGRKYAGASANVKKNVAAEQKRARC
jgi:tol-pal system protein YbgF